MNQNFSGSRDPISLETAERMLSYVRGVETREVWVKMAYVLRDEFGDVAFDAWDQWSQGAPNYNARDARDVWKSCKGGSSTRATIGALIALAKEGGYKPTAQDRKPVDPEEMKRLAQARAERLESERLEAEEAAKEAAAKAVKMWEAATADRAHPYLALKQIPGAGARVLREMLLVPLRHGPGALVGLQVIHADGSKKFLTGTPKAGAYTTIGKPSKTGTIVIAEGYATAVSIHMATGYCVVVAFDAGNLLVVAKKIRAALPDAALVMAADDDFQTDGNPGLTAAHAAALAVGATVAIPRWIDDRGTGTDFNDLHVAEGLDAVRQCFEDPLPPGGDDNPEQDNAASVRPEVVPAAPEANNPASAGTVVSPAVAGAPINSERPLIFSSMPMKTAELFHSTLPEGGRIIFWRGEFYSWDGCRYVVRDMVYMEQRLYFWMAGCDTWKVDPKTGDTEVVEFNPKPANVRDVCHALRAVCYTSAPDAGCWLDERSGDFPGSEILAFQNCFLHWPSGAILPSTDRLLVTSALEFDYDASAPAPTAWLGFLAGIWADDRQAIDTLAEMFGYLLTDDTSQQKIFMLIGPPRSGKGTILRILEALVGRSNRCSPTLSSLGGPFGLQSLLGKRMAMISDARLSGRSDQQPIVENLLRISGEDAVDVNRKNLPSLDGVTLRARFVMATNELPAFSDASSALANRFIPFKFTRSFLGSEDHGLTDRLLSELPSILLWALEGLNRLRARGYFVVPESAREVSSDLLDQTSPIRTFVADMCLVGDQYQCDRDDLYRVWKEWCEEQGRDHPGTKVGFGRQIHAAFPTIKRSQPRESGTRLNLYTGIRLRHDFEKDDGPY